MNELKNLENIILKSTFNNYDYLEISESIFEQCKNLKEGKWIIAVGEQDKYIIKWYINNKLLACNIGNFKIVISYMP